MLLSMTCALAQGGTTGPLTWEINNGTLTISGEGKMPVYLNIQSPWYDYRDDIHTLLIENGVTSITPFAFGYFSNLTSISIANTVLSIEVFAFTECKRLPSINLPDGLLNIPLGTFSSCSALSSVFISRSITNIDLGAFSGCYNLTSFEVDTESNTFASENGVLFNKDKTVLVSYPTGKSDAYVIPNSVKVIGDGAFSSCTNLTSLTIPNGVISIGGWAFSNCTSLLSITIPNTVTNIGSCAFLKCENLQLITNLNPVPLNINDDVFQGVNQNDCNLEVPTGSVTAYEEANVWKEFNVVGGGFLVNPISNNSEQGYTTGDGLYELNATATVTATACTGYKFVNWTKNGEELTTANPYSFTVTEDVELVAHFEDYVGVDELQITNYELRVYPNPTTGELTINNEQLIINNVEVFDVYGRKQKAEGRKQKAESEMVLDVAHLGSGIYFIKVYTEKGVFVEKVIKN